MLRTTKTSVGIYTWKWLAVLYLPVCDLKQI